MRKTIGFVLLGLGAALLAVGIVTTTWAPGVVKKTPLDVETTTRLDGVATRLGGEERPIKVFSLTRTDSKASNDETAVFVAVQCVVYTDEGDVPDCGEESEETDQTGGTEEGGDPRVLSIGIDKFATDRVSALSVDEQGFIPADDIGLQHEGIVNKFPFDTEKKDYPYWDSLTGRAWPAEFVEVEDMDGLETYHFSITIKDAEAEVIPDEQGTYSNQTDIWVEPETGAVVRQMVDQQRVLNGEQVLDLKSDFTDDQVKTSIQDSKDNLAQLHLITKTMPIVGFVGGILFLLVGAAVVLLGRRKRDDEVAVSHRQDPVPAGR